MPPCTLCLPVRPDAFSHPPALKDASTSPVGQWQREELNDWLNENLSELVAMGLLDDPLQNKLAQLRASRMGIDLDPDSDFSLPSSSISILTLTLTSQMKKTIQRTAHQVQDW